MFKNSVLSLVFSVFFMIGMSLQAYAMDNHADHMAAMNLFDNPTHEVVASGNWSNPNIWAGGVFPDDGAKVLIPSGFVVQFDLDESPRLFTLSVDGKLTFATNKTTRLYVDTIGSMGPIEMGTEENPIADHVRAEIIFTNDGPIDNNWDPAEISRGLITMAPFSMVGTRKTPHVPLYREPRAGDDFIVVEGPISNWQVLDQLVITGTNLLGYHRPCGGCDFEYQGSEDEVRHIEEILPIQGTNRVRLVLNDPLEFDHKTPQHSGDVDLKIYVANLTRNVALRSEDGPETPVRQRGHFMAMHQDTLISGAGFYDLGRTDKSRWIDDPASDANGGFNMDGSPANGTNPRGRYSIHFHKLGADNHMSNPVEVRNSVVWGNPGWGIAVHQTHGVIEDNVSFDVYGSHYVTEDGNEIAAFRRNIAVKAQGRKENGVKDGRHLHDLGFKGHGFWFQGRNVISEDNISIGTNHAAHIWFHRSDITQNITMPLSVAYEPFDIAKFREGALMTIDDIPIRKAEGLVCYAAEKCVHVIKANPHQWHGLRSVFSDITAWNVIEGLHIEYTKRYTFINTFLFGQDRHENPGHTAFVVGNNTDDVVAHNLHIENFDTGLSWSENTNWGHFAANTVLSNMELVAVAQNYDNFSANDHTVITRPRNFHLENHDPAVYTPSPDLSFLLPATLNYRDENSFMLAGTLTDSLGTWDYTDDMMKEKWNGQNIRNYIRDVGYYTKVDGTPYLPIRQAVADRLTGQFVYQDYELLLREDHTQNRTDLGEYVRVTHVAPNANSDQYTMQVGKILRVNGDGVLSNDSALRGNDLQTLPTFVVPPENGTVNLNFNGSFIYQPNPGFAGEDQFQYRAYNGETWSSPASVTIVVQSQNAQDVCAIDYNRNDTLELNDVVMFIQYFQAQDQLADLDDNGQLDAQDVAVFRTTFAGGC